jgi:hypothetical protein
LFPDPVNLSCNQNQDLKIVFWQGSGADISQQQTQPSQQTSQVQQQQTEEFSDMLQMLQQPGPEFSDFTMFNPLED